MDITPLVPQGKQVITGYGGGQFRISGEVYETSVLVFHDDVMAWDAAANKAITLESLQPIFDMADEIDILLIGCTKAQMLLPPKIKTAFKEEGIAIEIMDTGAAVRTYNVLMAEGRRVVAALVVV